MVDTAEGMSRTGSRHSLGPPMTASLSSHGLFCIPALASLSATSLDSSPQSPVEPHRWAEGPNQSSDLLQWGPALGGA